MNPTPTPTLMILFLDLDGTIRRPQGQSQFIEHPDDQEIIPGALEAIATTHADLIVGITDQWRKFP